MQLRRRQRRRRCRKQGKGQPL